MNSIGKIVGFPVKLFHNHRIYIPKEYLRYYGISDKKDRLIISKSENSLFLRPTPKDGIPHPKKGTVSIIAGLTVLPISWVRGKNLNYGDTLFLLGTEDGLLVSV